MFLTQVKGQDAQEHMKGVGGAVELCVNAGADRRRATAAFGLLQQTKGSPADAAQPRHT